MPEKKSPPSNPPSPTTIWPTRVLIWVIVAAVLIAGAAFSFIKWAEIWDHPDLAKKQTPTTTAEYKGNLIQVSIECNCPPYLIEGRSQVVSLTFHLIRKAPAKGALAPQSVQGAVAPADLAKSKPSLQISTFLDSPGATILAPDAPGGWYLGNEQQLDTGIQQTITFTIIPRASGRLPLAFHLDGYESETKVWNPPFIPEIIEFDWAAQPPFRAEWAPGIYALAIFAIALAGLLITVRLFDQLRSRNRREIEALDSNDVWGRTRLNLQAYFDRNLLQVNLVFWFAVFVMSVGFTFVIAGVVLALKSPPVAEFTVETIASKDATAKAPVAAETTSVAQSHPRNAVPTNSRHLDPAELAVLSGIITQFIGATFLVIYRSTMRQANDFMNVLERINTVAMAVHELDRISDPKGEFKDEVRGRLVEALVATGRLKQSTGAAPDDGKFS